MSHAKNEPALDALREDLKLIKVLLALEAAEMCQLPDDFESLREEFKSLRVLLIQQAAQLRQLRDHFAQVRVDQHPSFQTQLLTMP